MYTAQAQNCYFQASVDAEFGAGLYLTDSDDGREIFRQRLNAILFET